MATPTTLTATREIRGSAHWIHITGPSALIGNAGRKAGAEARKWAKELGKSRAYRVSSGGEYGTGTFRHSVCYGFDA